MSTLEHDLLGTTDAQVWAREFIRLFGEDLGPRVDEGLMIGWFANAIETGRTAGQDFLAHYLADRKDHP